MSVVVAEPGLHQLAPYIGKMRPSTARKLILEFTREGELIVDPFVGSGTVALEAFINRRQIVCADTNPYAHLLTMAKLYPPNNLALAIKRVKDRYSHISIQKVQTRPLNPKWVSGFFHPETLAETRAIAVECRRQGDYFTMACLLGILHHQRPGFLSYPANHLVPYLLTKKYPRSKFKSMYSYRAVLPRLLAKVERAYRRFPSLDFGSSRRCSKGNGLELPLHGESVDAIITSPPYMDNLDYFRDNRLRLWFLGVKDGLPSSNQSQSLEEFRAFMTKTFLYAHRVLRKGGYCILVLGTVKREDHHYRTAHLAKSLAISQLRLFRLAKEVRYPFPQHRRSRPQFHGTTSETILILRK
jgi:hypothetical protein